MEAGLPQGEEESTEGLWCESREQSLPLVLDTTSSFFSRLQIHEEDYLENRVWGKVRMFHVGTPYSTLPLLPR